MDTLKMAPHSYADEQWLLFVREDEDSFVFTAVVTDKDKKNVVAELKADAKSLEEHIEELGIEVEPKAFRKMLVQTLEERKSVAVELESEESEILVLLELTYTFGPSISRKGVFQLPVVAKDAPESVVRLLKSVHEQPPLPILTTEEKLQREKKSLSGVKNGDGTAAKSSSQNGSASATSSQSSDTNTTATVNPMALKRRHVPSGTTRRKGPKGARLAKANKLQ